MRLSKKYWGVVQDGYGSSSDWMPKHLPHFFPGTLNVKLEESLNFLNNPRIFWHKQFRVRLNDFPKETTKIVRVSRCKINGIDAFLINPPKVSLDKQDPFAEIGAKFGLRKNLGLKNGDRVWIRFYIK